MTGWLVIVCALLLSASPGAHAIKKSKSSKTKSKGAATSRQITAFLEKHHPHDTNVHAVVQAAQARKILFLADNLAPDHLKNAEIYPTGEIILDEETRVIGIKVKEVHTENPVKGLVDPRGHRQPDILTVKPRDENINARELRISPVP